MFQNFSIHYKPNFGFRLFFETHFVISYWELLISNFNLPKKLLSSKIFVHCFFSSSALSFISLLLIACFGMFKISGFRSKKQHECFFKGISYANFKTSIQNLVEEVKAVVTYKGEFKYRCESNFTANFQMFGILKFGFQDQKRWFLNCCFALIM